MDITDVPLPCSHFDSKTALPDIVCVTMRPESKLDLKETVKQAKNAKNVRVAGRLYLEKCDDNEDGIEFFDAFSAYYKQARAFYEAGADLFFADSMLSVADARAALLACKRFDIPVFVTVYVDTADIAGAKSYAVAALICLQEMGADACGIVSDCDVEDCREIVSELARYAKVPLIALVNRKDECADVLSECGAAIVAQNGDSACLRVCRIKEPNALFDAQACEGMLMLSNQTQSFFLSPDNIEISEYIQCVQDMSDKLLEIGETSVDIIGVELFSPDDAVLFMKNVHMASLPVIFKSQSVTALTTALILYPGRACIDSCCELATETLLSLAQKYGAILY